MPKAAILGPAFESFTFSNCLTSQHVTKDEQQPLIRQSKQQTLCACFRQRKRMVHMLTFTT